MTTTTTAIPRKSADELFDEFSRLRRAGYSYNEIGSLHGLSHERVRQVLWRNDKTGEFRKSAPRYKRQEQIEEITAFLEEHGPVERSVVLERFEITSNRLNSLISSGVPSHLILTTARNVPTFFTEDKVFDAIRTAWAELQGINPDSTGLSHVLYERLRRMDDPSAPLIVGRYGWADACAKAGVPAGETWRDKGTYTSQWSDQDIFAAVGEFVNVCRADGVRPSYLHYERYQQLDSTRPSGSLVRNRMRAIGLTTWPSIVTAAAASSA